MAVGEAVAEGTLDAHPGAVALDARLGDAAAELADAQLAVRLVHRAVVAPVERGGDAAD